MRRSIHAAAERIAAMHTEPALRLAFPHAPEVASPLTPAVALEPAEVVNGADAEIDIGFPPESTTPDALMENARM